MGFLSFLGLDSKRIDQLSTPTDITLASPWGNSGNLKQIVVSDIYGSEIAAHLPLTREVAITVPAVSRARNLLIGQIQKYPLIALNEDGPLTNQPTFLYRTNGPVTVTERAAWTIDSLLFYGLALWVVDRGSVGQVLDARWCPHTHWRIENDAIELRSASDEWFVADESAYILINSPFEGLLNVAARTIRGAIATEEAWTGRMRNPIPVLNLKSTQDVQLDDDEIDALVAAVSKARTSVNGAVAFTPYGIELEALGAVSADLFTEGRNAIRTDIGSFTNIPTSMMDGSLAEASLTYATQEGNRNRFNEESIPFWTVPIEAALSQDNVVPSGTRVRFDRSEDYALTPTSTGIPEKD